MGYNAEIFDTFNKGWALVTAGTIDHFNTMTISWGGLGTIWGMPVATVYVRTSRYTHDFMDDNEYFTVSFYPEDMKKTLGILGSKSGREIDKMHMPELTAIEAGKSVSFHEAEVTLVCRKVFKQTLEPKNMEAKIAEQFYGKDAPHDMYIGEVVDIIRR